MQAHCPALHSAFRAMKDEIKRYTGAVLNRLMSIIVVTAVTSFATVLAQQSAPPRFDPESVPTTPASVAKLGPGLFRIGEIKVDTTKHEASVPGKINAVQILEFVANTRG